MMAWDFLATLDLLVICVVAFRRICGKPTNWKIKLRGLDGSCSEADSEAQTPKPKTAVPPRALVAGMIFIFIVEASETAMSCWCFTYASTVLMLPPKVAALFPSMFYFGFTGARFVVLPISRTLLPSTIAHVGSLLILAGCVTFFLLCGVASTSGNSSAYVNSFLACLLIIGGGSSPLFAMGLGCIKQLGDLDAQEIGLYSSCAAMGICVGNFLPGMVPLPTMELVGALCIVSVLNSHLRYFPWQRPKVAEN